VANDSPILGRPLTLPASNLPTLSEPVLVVIFVPVASTANSLDYPNRYYLAKAIRTVLQLQPWLECITDKLIGGGWHLLIVSVLLFGLLLDIPRWVSYDY